MDVSAHIVSLERSALDCWIRANPDGYLSLYVAACDAFFDPFQEKRVDGLDSLSAQLAPMRRCRVALYRATGTTCSTRSCMLRATPDTSRSTS